MARFFEENRFMVAIAKDSQIVNVMGNKDYSSLNNAIKQRDKKIAELEKQLEALKNSDIYAITAKRGKSCCFRSASVWTDSIVKATVVAD